MLRACLLIVSSLAVLVVLLLVLAPTPPRQPEQPEQAEAPARAEGIALLACTMVRNNARLVPEWLAFHRLQGVARFVLYDDGSDEVDYADALREWIAAGVVTLLRVNELVRDPRHTLATAPYAATAPRAWTERLRRLLGACRDDERDHEWSMLRCQQAVFADCAVRVRTSAEPVRWMIFMDVDEFVFRPLDAVTGASPGPIHALLDAQQRALYPVSGVVFGTAGHVERDWTGLVIESHTQRPALDADGNLLPCGATPPRRESEQIALKTFVRGDRVDPTSVEGRLHVPATSPRERDVPVRGALPSDPLRLVHFQLLSLADVRAKADVNRSTYYRRMLEPGVLDCLSAAEDTQAAAFANRVRVCMNSGPLSTSCTSL